MTYAFSLGNGSDSRLFSHTGDIIHVFVHGGREIQTLMDAATSPSIRMYVISIYCATDPPPQTKKEAQIAKIKTTAITVRSVKGFLWIFFL